MTGPLRMAAQSFRGYIRLVGRSSLHLRQEQVHQTYKITDGNYTVFRETVNTTNGSTPTILVVGFRLRLIRSSKFMHWCFQRASITTTPFWSGLPGFHTKLWMINTSTKDYLGIYEWYGQAEADAYIDYLLPILTFFSVKSTVWYRYYPGLSLNQFLLQSG